jgi:hypothetical protein
MYQRMRSYCKYQSVREPVKENGSSYEDSVGSGIASCANDGLAVIVSEDIFDVSSEGGHCVAEVPFVCRSIA